ncbi:hypothetical protein ACFQZ4_01935 [Catellatospora coxensis]|uniref:Uncharacterized protein n=1 Tax=Catellatospora coxensis TaxID=310354 RepID=A0A8J3L5N8_9ACTN|nr:hypothetical protein [Catellatospora coxensis]GIG08290.1 hypothetical protein Cco03nite_49900 [Catellatospora coxensis]
MTRHRFHGDETRFDVLAEYVTSRFPQARYVADVAGGQGMLTRLLRKRFGLEAEVVDPRGWTLKGVPARAEPYLATLADYYDLIVGLHPDEALREVVDSARVRPVLVVPCCNFWDRDRKLGRDELMNAITAHHRALGGRVEHVELAFRGPKNHALVLLPPRKPGRDG